MGVKTWQELAMPPLSLDQRGFNRSERAWDSSMLSQRIGMGSQQLPLSASHRYFYPPTTLTHKHCRKLYQIPETQMQTLVALAAQGLG